jgi:hypothetical protein
MSNFSDTLINIERSIDSIKLDQPKVEKGVTKAARRVRKELQSIAKWCKEGRKHALEASKSK